MTSPVALGRAQPVTAGRVFAVRLAALAALALYSGAHWATIVAPGAGGDLVAMLVIAVAAALTTSWVLARPERGARRVALPVVALVTLAAVLLAAGAPLGMLRPDHWDDLAVELGAAIGALPALRVPYRGKDEWIRTVLLSGGGLLLASGALLALLPRPRIFGAAACLGVLYAVPIVERGPQHPYLDGAVFAVLLGLLLWGGRLHRGDAPLAVTLAVAALVVAALVAPRVDSATPWVDYEEIAESLQAGRSTTFTWNHSYAPLTWPRDGVELARVRSKGDLYLKTADLERFDGTTWRQASVVAGGDGLDTEFSARHPEWTQTIHVTVKALKSTQFLGSGTTSQITRSTKRVREATPGTFEVIETPLRRGDSYDARVYVPQPNRNELKEAGTDYPWFLARQLVVDVPPRAGSGVSGTQVRIPPWGASSLAGRFWLVPDPEPALAASSSARSYELAQSLKAGSTDPAEYVRRVIARVQRGARYTESPPPPGAMAPLEAFLFRDRAGYCQHFAGATALLLRLGGVPARVAAGFSPGSQDAGERVIRDLDAHSWVEAYFPGLGWVTFDPTPADSPARTQITDTQRDPSATTARQTEVEVTGLPQGGAPGGGLAAVSQVEPAEGSSWWWMALLLAVAAAGLVVLVLTAHRRLHLARSDDPEVEELRQALARSGRRPPPEMTLARLEGLLGGGGADLDYLAALRLSRYGAGAPPPTATQRRELRRRLGAGLGARGRLRSLWALPPRPGELLEALRPRRRRPYIG